MAAAINAACTARAKVDVFMLDPRCPEFAAEAARVIRARGARTRSASSAVQAGVRGGWSGGGRTKPSPTASSATEWVVRIACRSGKATASEGPAWVVFRTHIATSGQSWQSLLFWSSGQQVMSADIDMSLIPSERACAAAAGAAKGAKVKPTVTETANATLSNRRRFMARTSHGRRNFGSPPGSHVRQPNLQDFSCSRTAPESVGLHWRARYPPLAAEKARPPSASAGGPGRTPDCTGPLSACHGGLQLWRL